MIALPKLLEERLAWFKTKGQVQNGVEESQIFPFGVEGRSPHRLLDCKIGATRLLIIEDAGRERGAYTYLLRNERGPRTYNIERVMKLVALDEGFRGRRRKCRLVCENSK
jgi:hypothetical protein